MKKLQAKTHTYKQPMDQLQELAQDRLIFKMSDEEEEIKTIYTEVDILKHNIFELNEQLYNAYKRIAKLREDLENKNTLN